jgi:dTDP-4-dehydrorhamnose reductase
VTGHTATGPAGVTRWLVTGAGGMLGRDLVAALTDRDVAGGTDRQVTRGTDRQVAALDRGALDITDVRALARAVKGHDIVVNAAAWTDVDGAEGAEQAATAINGRAVSGMAQACAEAGAVLLHVSTDYVFPGRAEAPYSEDAPTAPINAYGRSKLVGELAVREHLPTLGYVVRTAWLYGEHGHNFVTTMLELAAKRNTVDVVDDQRGQPTWSGALAARLVELGDAALTGAAVPGVYHGTAAGQTTWYGLARAVFAEAGLDPDRVRPTTSAAFVRPAARPAYSVLGHDRWSAAGLGPMAPWDLSLRQALSRPSFAELIAALPGASSGAPSGAPSGSSAGI